MKTPITALPSVDNSLAASSISRPDKTQITVQPLQDLQGLSEILTSNIEFLNGESISTFKWIRLENTSFVKQSVSKKRRNSISDPEDSTLVDASNIQYIDYLVVLLHTGEILIYSTFTKEFINKITIDSPFSAIDVINKVGHSKKSLYKYDYDLITFDPKDSSLKFFSSTSPQLIDSVQFTHDPLISYILFNTDILETTTPTTSPELFLASTNTLYLLDNHHELIKSIDISLTPSSPVKKGSKSSSASSSDSTGILKIVKQDSKLYIVHNNSSIIQVVDIESKKKTKSQILNTSSPISDISIINSKSKTPIVSATLIDGSIELFKTTESSSFAQLHIKGGKDVGKFIGLLNSNDIIDEVYKGIWYDNFVIQITDFEFDNINNLKGPITIAVGETENDDTDLLEFVSAEEGDFDEENVDVDIVLKSNDKDSDVSDEDTDVEDDNESTQITDSLECEDLNQFSKLLKSKLKALTTENTEESLLTEILSQNITFAKSTIYILSVEESNLLFSKVAYIVSQYPNSFNQDFAVITNIKEWLKWLLVLRGSVITQNEESVEWLKLLHSELKQEAKNLNNMIKLTGKLSLLRDQLAVRNEMMNKNDDQSEEESDDETSLNNDGTSVVLDGEGGFDEDVDSDNNADSPQESGDDETV